MSHDDFIIGISSKKTFHFISKKIIA